MTDRQIIKALSEMLYVGNSCVTCKYDNGRGDDRCGLRGCKIARSAVDLINRQRAEIEKLQAEKEAMLDTIHKLGDDYADVLGGDING